MNHFLVSGSLKYFNPDNLRNLGEKFNLKEKLILLTKFKYQSVFEDNDLMLELIVLLNP